MSTRPNDLSSRPDRPSRPGARRDLLALMACAAGLSGLGAVRMARAAPAGTVDPDTTFARNFAAVRLLDQSGRTVQFKRMTGKVLLVNFVYTGCSSVCPVQTAELVALMDALPPDVRDGCRFVSLSLDPLSDTPAALSAYARRMGADTRRWSFVTGDPVALGQVIDRLKLFKPDGKRPDDHTTNLWLIDRQGRPRMRLPGRPVDSVRVARELADLLQAT